MRFALLFTVLLVAGCATVDRTADQPDPARSANLDRHPAILIPGLLGSRLARADTGVEVWPGGATKLLTSDYLELALRIDPATLEPIDDGLVPSGIFESAIGQDFYGRLIHELRHAGGYRLARPGRAVIGQRARLYVLAYDWRQDNTKTVQKLDELIEQIRSDYQDSNLRVDVIAHSMGGLIVRYYERYGTADVLDGDTHPVTGRGVSKLRRVVLLGTPNQGTVTALHKFVNGYQVGFSTLPTEGLATMPSTYQLFPHPLVDWIVNVNGDPLDFDVFDVEFWRRQEWSIFDHRIQRRMDRQRDVWPAQDVYERWFQKRLERGRRFAWSLMAPARDIAFIKPLLLGSGCVPTPRRLVLENIAGESAARLQPEQILKPKPGIDYESLMLAPGDGSVTLESLLSQQSLSRETHPDGQEAPAIERANIVCAQHDALTSDEVLLDALIQYLVAPDPAVTSKPR